MQHDIREKAHMSLEPLMFSSKSSMQNDKEEEEEAHIPFNSLLLSIRNPTKCDMEEEALIKFKSLMSSIKKKSMQNAIGGRPHFI
jgi:hypothetical protein